MLENEVLSEGSNRYGRTMSKATFCGVCNNTSHTAVHIAKFQVVRSGGKAHAEYLVVAELGFLTFGVWRRFKDFEELARGITRSSDMFPNSNFSWQCMRYRKRWYRCLDHDYLTVKCFLLERFLHDCICESPDQSQILDFIGV